MKNFVIWIKISTKYLPKLHSSGCSYPYLGLLWWALLFLGTLLVFVLVFVLVFPGSSSQSSSQVSIHKFEAKEDEIIPKHEQVADHSNQVVEYSNLRYKMNSSVSRNKSIDDWADSTLMSSRKYALKYHTGKHYDRECFRYFLHKKGEIPGHIEYACDVVEKLESVLGLGSARTRAACGEFAYSFADISKVDLDKTYTSEKGDTIHYWYYKLRPDLRCGYNPDYGQSGPPEYPQ